MTRARQSTLESTEQSLRPAPTCKAVVPTV